MPKIDEDSKSVKLSPFKQFCEKWRRGCGNEMCKKATRVVLSRGFVPADIVFIGMCPGNSEDVIGLPFIGPAGSLLDRILDRALPPNTRFAITNLTACMPRDENGDEAPPEDSEIAQCSTRLKEFVQLCDPKVIVTIGAQSRDWTDPKEWRSVRFHKAIPMVDIVHPAWILRQPIAHQSLLIQRSVVTIAKAVREYLGGESGN